MAAVAGAAAAAAPTKTEQAAQDRNILCLTEECLVKVLENLSTADRNHLSCACHALRQIWRQTVGTVCITEQDLELYDDQPLCTFPHMSSLILQNINMDWDCACFLAGTQQLQQLTSINVQEPTSFTADGFILLLQTCRLLTSIQVSGEWGCAPDDGSSNSVVQLPQQRPLRLGRLSLGHNSRLKPRELLALLSADSLAVCNLADVSAPGRGHSSTCGHSCQQLRQLMATEGYHMTTLQPAWPSVRELDLSGCNMLGGNWGFLALLPSLQTLVLHSCYKVTNSTLAAFNKALGSRTGRSSSESGTCGGTDPGSGGGATETAAANAAAASVAVSSSSNIGCASTSWAVSGTMGSPAFPLRHLDLSYTRVSDGGMPSLAAALPQLQWLGLKGCNVGDDGLLHLLQLQQLTALHLKHCHRVTDEGVQQLSVLGRLQQLSYGYTSMPEADDVAAAIAGQFKQLTALDLLASELTDRGLAALGSGLLNLQQLRLYQAGVTVDGLSQFAEQPASSGLSSLVLYGLGGLTQLECLASFPALQQLQLGGLCDLQDVPSCIEHLGLLPQLQHLMLERVDGITARSLQHVLSQRHLTCLKVRGCDGVSQDDMEQLARGGAQYCNSSASVWWAGAASCDTDDEEEGWQLLQP